MRDPRFGEKADEILRYWGAATKPNPHQGSVQRKERSDIAITGCGDAAVMGQLP